MTSIQWAAFCKFRDAFKLKTAEWAAAVPDLCELQACAAQQDTPPYPIETPVVYSRDFDTVTRDNEIKLIVVGDNPGKDEQREINRRYLVGQSGKIAEGFFRRNPELGIDFRKNTLILNKTPVHTAKTGHLKYLAAHSVQAAQLIQESQEWMAKATAQLHQTLTEETCCALWLVGYGELKHRGIFALYRDTLCAAYTGNSAAWEQVQVFRHFSMNSFLTELRKLSDAQQAAGTLCSLNERLTEIGTTHRREIFGMRI